MAAEYGYLKTVSKTKVQETIKNGLHFILLLLLAIRLFASCLEYKFSEELCWSNTSSRF